MEGMHVYRGHAGTQARRHAATSANGALSHEVRCNSRELRGACEARTQVVLVCDCEVHLGTPHCQRPASLCCRLALDILFVMVLLLMVGQLLQGGDGYDHAIVSLAFVTVARGGELVRLSKVTRE